MLGVQNNIAGMSPASLNSESLWYCGEYLYCVQLVSHVNWNGYLQHFHATWSGGNVTVTVKPIHQKSS